MAERVTIEFEDDAEARQFIKVAETGRIPFLGAPLRARLVKEDQPPADNPAFAEQVLERAVDKYEQLRSSASHGAILAGILETLLRVKELLEQPPTQTEYTLAPPVLSEELAAELGILPKEQDG